MADHQVAADSIRADERGWETAATGCTTVAADSIRAGKRGMPTAATDERTEIRDRLKRLYIPNAIYFITAVSENRQPVFARDGAIELLRVTMHTVQEIHPFGMRGFVFLHDHLHLLLYVPEQTTISQVMHSLKRNYTRNYKDRLSIDGSLRLWQRRFWDHVIRDERDFLNHLDYIHWNPVKHGYVLCPVDYAHSSFHEYVRRGWYDAAWGAIEPESIQGVSFE